ncbi:hypothetical protein [Eubacterium oxidoreducens]|nr:hypothetical protein [Eubacterium oxidoreducens]
MSGLRSDADADEIKAALVDYDFDKELKKYKDQLTKNVPYYACSQII